eukprot:gene47935-64314_t
MRAGDPGDSRRTRWAPPTLSKKKSGLYAQALSLKPWRGLRPPMSETTPRLLRALAGETLDRPPIWFMRQAGRSLPEYRELRTRAKDFMAFCFNPEMAAEATLQPMRRFPMDGAIVFADILLLPQALGQEVWFEAGEGPRLGALPEIAVLRDAVEGSTAKLSSI